MNCQHQYFTFQTWRKCKDIIHLALPIKVGIRTMKSFKQWYWYPIVSKHQAYLTTLVNYFFMFFFHVPGFNFISSMSSKMVIILFNNILIQIITIWIMIRNIPYFFITWVLSESWPRIQSSYSPKNYMYCFLHHIHHRNSKICHHYIQPIVPVHRLNLHKTWL